MRSKSRFGSVSALLAAAIVLMLSSCGEQSTGPAMGNLKVNASTVGSDLDPDGYTVTVDGGDARTIGVNGSVTYTDLPAGSHSVALADLSENCSVGGGNPRTLDVSDGSTAPVSFEVSCSPMVGDLALSVATTGSDLDPDGYTVTVDGDSVQALGVNDSGMLADVHAGSHQVELTGVSANCTVAGDNPKTVSITYQGSSKADFAVNCVLRTGAVDVTAATSGSDPDPDGYTLSVDGGSGTSLGANGSTTLSDLTEGDHTLELSGVAANCAVDGDNPRTVSVAFGSTASTTFDIACSARTGAVDVGVSTTGSDIDPDGYTVQLDGSASKSVGVNGSVTFGAVEEGTHTVQLTGVAANCTVGDPNPQNLSVPYQGTAQTTFSVACSARTGNLDVSTSTTGSDVDPDGYTVTVDGAQSQSVGVNGSVTFTGLAEGDHTVALAGLAGNCTTTNSPRTVTVPFNGTASTAFDVTCTARTGDLQASASTTGSDQDPDGYTVTVDGGSAKSLAVNGSVTFSGLAEGDHTVALSGLAGNCTTSNNPRTVTVPFNGTGTTTFDVTCTARTGDLQVSASTSGTDLDPDGYTVTVDGGSAKSLPVNGSVTFNGLSEGDHTVQLTGDAANCTVGGSNPRTVTVPFNGTGTTAFDVVCSANLGNVQVTAATTGSDLDPDGYTVTLDGTLSQGISTNGSVTFNNVSVGTHSVELSGNASNCTINTTNPQSVDVTYSSTATATFDVSCEPLTGDLSVTTVTTGSGLPGGYQVVVDGGQTKNVGTNGTVIFSSVATGDHSVELTGVPDNCTLTGDNPRTVTVSGGSGSTTFDLSCFSALSNKIVFSTDRDGDFEIYVMNTDGSGQTRLTNNPQDDRLPAVSPDGLKIAFNRTRAAGGRDIWVMNADGSGEVQLTSSGTQNYGPAWSPDGTQIAFARRAGGNTDIYVMNANGSGLTRLTTDAGVDEFPTWSPDSTKIAFTSDRDGDADIYIMNANGTGITQVTTDPGHDFAPDWSPDGTQITFSSDRNGQSGDVFLINPDGTGETNITNNPAPDFDSRWSPGGAQIVFTSWRVDNNRDIWIMNADGTNVIRLTVDGGTDTEATFSP